MMKQSITLAVLVMTSCLCRLTDAAGWDTNVWPAYEHPREVRQQMEDCYNALSERCQVAFWSCTAPAFYRTFRSDLHELKTSLHELFDGVAYPFAATNLSDPDGSFDTWYTNQTCTGDYLSDPLPELSWTGLCSIARIPTNFFTFTPYRSEIAGLGGFTNDIAVVGHAHGYTNAETAAGGPFYPSGRTNWYTTDYGLDALKAAIRCLAWTHWVPPGEGRFVADSKSGANASYSNTWANAVAGAEAVTNAGYDSVQIITSGHFQDALKYSAAWRSCTWYYEISAPDWATNISRLFDVYDYAGASSVGYPPAPVFDAYGTSVRDSEWTRLATTNSVLAQSVTSAVLGSVAIPSPWTAEPSSGTNTTRGFQMASEYPRVIMKWDFVFK